MEILTPAILLRVIEYLDIPTFLNCRLTNRSIAQLVEKHQASLTASIIERVFPPYLKKLKPPKAPLNDGIKRLLLLQQRHEVLRQTANIVVAEAPMCYPRHAVDDSLADEYRVDIQRGLAILWQLSDIAETVETTARQTESGRRRFLGFLQPSETTVHRKLEDEVLSKRLDYIQNDITAEDAFLFHLMCMAAFAKFHGGFYEIADHRWSGPGGFKYAVGRGDCWLYWYILRHGPPVLLALWNPDVTSYDQTVRIIDEEFSGKPKAFVKIERKAARGVHRELKNVNPASSSNYLRGLLKKNGDRLRAAELEDEGEVSAGSGLGRG
jgi:hypothetical protein